YLAHSHRVVTIDGRETAPETFPQDAFIDPATGKPIPFNPQRITSGMAVGIPGTLATWATAENRHGSMSLNRLLQPAIAVARQGFVVDKTYHDQTDQNASRLRIFTSSRAFYLDQDQAPAIGTTVRNPQLASTYELIAKSGPGALYRGPIGAAFVQAPLKGLLSTGFAAERRCLIGPTAAASPVHAGDPTPPYSGCPAGSASAAGPEGDSTNHLTVVDRNGNVVSYTSTIEQIAGSAIAVPGYGFLLNNELTDFDP